MHNYLPCQCSFPQPHPCAHTMHMQGFLWGCWPLSLCRRRKRRHAADPAAMSMAGDRASPPRHSGGSHMGAPSKGSGSQPRDSRHSLTGRYQGGGAADVGRTREGRAYSGDELCMYVMKQRGQQGWCICCHDMSPVSSSVAPPSCKQSMLLPY
jgi:hypothetical protein